MKTTASSGLAGVAALVCAGSVLAHHSGYMYQTTPIWITGSVTRFELKNPHTITTLEARSEDGQVRLWAVEGPPQTALGRRSGDGEYVPKVGDKLEERCVRLDGRVAPLLAAQELVSSRVCV